MAAFGIWDLSISTGSEPHRSGTPKEVSAIKDNIRYTWEYQYNYDVVDQHNVDKMWYRQ